MTAHLKQKSAPQRSKGIDQFRMIAAVMVIAIHTFPFASIHGVLDQIITLTLFRVAVPFFFMVTGYYVVGPYAEKKNYPKSWKINRAIIETLKLYLLSCLLYLPLSFYTGALSFSMPFVKLVKVFVFDGPMYHLWYFPAVILGLLIVKFLLKRVSLPIALVITSILYLLALGGDSYYSFVEQVPALKTLYRVFFHLFDYTRNGLLFSPLFLCLGALVYHQRKQAPFLTTTKLWISLVLLGIEGFLLHQYTVLRHDSMFIVLPLASYYLFIWALNWQPRKEVKQAQSYSLGLYLLHPLSIAFLYYFSKSVGLLQNSLVHFFLTVLLTIGGTWIALNLLKVRGRTVKRKSLHRARKQLDQSALQKNYQTMQQLLPKQTKLMAVVKANAYGHGAVAVSRILEQEGVDFFAVATLAEAIELRKNGLQGELLILGYTDLELVSQLKQYDLIQSVFSKEYATLLNRKKVLIRCHLKIDTGMHRLGFSPTIQAVQSVYGMNYLSCEGIYSHLGSADKLESEAKKRTEKQINTFDQLLTELAERGINYGVTHLQSSYGVVHYPKLSYDYARVGIFLYGALSQPDSTLKKQLQLSPVLSIHAVLVSVKMISSGEYIGYGTAFSAKREMKIGTVAIGYADGVSRELSNTGYALRYKDFDLPQVGRICMDMLLVDLSEVPEIAIGAEIEVAEGSEQLAVKSKTITNEVLSRLGTRLEYDN